GRRDLQRRRRSRLPGVRLGRARGCRRRGRFRTPGGGVTMAIRVTVDVVIFTIRAGALHVLLVRRARPPFARRHAIPGGFVDEGESLEAAARRELAEETGLRDVYLEQLYTFGDPGRDPRGHVVTVAYFALIASDPTPLHAGTDAAEAGWFPVGALPSLAFDHS